MKSRSQSQLNLPPSLLSNQEQAEDVRTKYAQADVQAENLLTKQEQALSMDDARDLSAVLIDEALKASGLTSDVVAFELGIDVSLVRKMRLPQNRERMSHTQILYLGFKHPRFYVEMSLALESRTGWFRRFAMQLQAQATALFAMASGK